MEPKLKISIDSLLSLLKYPKVAVRAWIQGIISVKFVVDTLGFAKNIKVKHGIWSGIDEAVKEVISELPFEPAYLNGKPVPREVVAILRFKILDKIKSVKMIY